jgi:uncharacterized protein
MTNATTSWPGSDGERYLQDLYGTRTRAERFYHDQVLDVLTPKMIEFVNRQTQMILSTADVDGHPDASVRFGSPGFVAVLDERTLAWPELRGNGVMTSLGNLAKNPWTHLMFLDIEERIGLHLRGLSTIVESEEMASEFPELANRPSYGRPPERWVILRLTNSYVHCRKHFPRNSADAAEDLEHSSDYFGARFTPSPWAEDVGPRRPSPAHTTRRHRPWFRKR